LVTAEARAVFAFFRFSLVMYLITDSIDKCVRGNIHCLMPRTQPPFPIPVRRAFRKLGADIRDARRRRRVPTAVLAERAMISRATLGKVERGEPSVSLGIYAAVLYALGLIDRLATVADAREDTVGLALEEERLPKRIARTAHRKKASGRDQSDKVARSEESPEPEPPGPS
jgi:transcriptional regulator with XRE-family HTH domain